MMKLNEDVQRRIEQVGAALAQALGERAVCVAVYGSAAGEEFSAAHSDINLLLVLRDVGFADLRLIGATLAREAGKERFATPLVLTPEFLRDARDAFPIELDDIRARHRVLAGEVVLAGLRIKPEHLREQAEREVRGKILRLRALVIHRPPDQELQHALASLATVLVVIERALLHAHLGRRVHGEALFTEVEQHTGVKLRALPRLQEIKQGQAQWPSGADLDDLLEAVLREVDALVRFIDDDQV